MPPRRANMDPAEMAALVAQQIAAVLPGMVAQLSQTIRQEGSSNTNPSTSLNPDTSDKHYKAFTNAQPINFTSSEGAAGLLHWFEKMETTFRMCKCPEDHKVLYASSMFMRRALTWWNNEMRTRGEEAALALTWTEFKDVVTKEFIPKSELQ